jgi:hypothetical protein
MIFFGHVNDLELFLRQIGTTAQALIRRLASAFLKTTFFFLFFFFFFWFFIFIDGLLPFAFPTRAVFCIPELKNARLL